MNRLWCYINGIEETLTWEAVYRNCAIIIHCTLQCSVDTACIDSIIIFAAI